MGHTIQGESIKSKIKLDGSKVIVENIGCYSYEKSVDKAFTYRKEVIYHFSSEDEAMEYYYKMR